MMDVKLPAGVSQSLPCIWFGVFSVLPSTRRCWRVVRLVVVVSSSSSLLLLLLMVLSFGVLCAAVVRRLLNRTVRRPGTLPELQIMKDALKQTKVRAFLTDNV